MRAPNARVVLIVKDVIGHIMRFDIRPDILAGPCCQWIEFDEFKLPIPFHKPRIGTSRGLVTANARHPRRLIFQHACEGFYFSHFAALIRLLKP